MIGRPVDDAEIVPAFVSGTDDPDISLDLTPGTSAPAVFHETHVTDDPFWNPAWTRAIGSVRDYLLDDTPPVITGVENPAGPSEFSFGAGGMPPIELADPAQHEQLQVVYRTDPADPSAGIDYSDRVSEPGSLPPI